MHLITPISFNVSTGGTTTQYLFDESPYSHHCLGDSVFYISEEKLDLNICSD